MSGLANARLAAERGEAAGGSDAAIQVVLVYPERYGLGMANLGFQTVFGLIHQTAGVCCERAFLPGPGEKPCGLESGRPLDRFDIVAFSISFENDYFHLPLILNTAGIPLRSRQRGESDPLIIAGGVATFLNPEPLAPFVDCFLLGEAELLISPFFERFKALWPEVRRQELLLELARSLPGAYVPCFYRPAYDGRGRLASFEPLADVPETIARVRLDDLSATPTCSRLITPEPPFSDRYLVEVGRGCPHGCRFCSAGYIYRPPRFRPLSLLRDCLDQGSRLTHRIGLMGAAISDLPDIEALCAHAQSRGLELSFSSLRADGLTDALIAAMRQSRVKTATIAPDAGSERMRGVINKGLSRSRILEATERLVSGGIPNLKLYFMIGLPFETEADIRAIVSLCQAIRAVFVGASRPRGRIGGISVSISPFVPKPATPFQWAGMDPPRILKRKIKALIRPLRALPNLRVGAEPPRLARNQAILARGDRRAADLLERLCQHQGNWPQSLKAWPTDPALFLGPQEKTACFAWDFIDSGVSRAFLWKEYQRAARDQAGEPCPMAPDCRRCGVCGHRTGGEGSFENFHHA